MLKLYSQKCVCVLDKGFDVCWEQKTYGRCLWFMVSKDFICMAVSYTSTFSKSLKINFWSKVKVSQFASEESVREIVHTEIKR